MKDATTMGHKRSASLLPPNKTLRHSQADSHRPQDHITLEMAPLEIRHRSVRPISAKHAQASRFLQQSHIDNLSRNQDIAVGLQVILKPRARPTPTWTSMPERTLDFEF